MNPLVILPASCAICPRPRSEFDQMNSFELKKRKRFEKRSVGPTSKVANPSNKLKTGLTSLNVPA